MKRSTGNEQGDAGFHKSRLWAVARLLPDWLKKFLEPEASDPSGLTPVNTGVNAEAAPFDSEASAAEFWNSFKPAGPPAGWIEMARKYAPRLLLPPEQGGTQWQSAAGVDGKYDVSRGSSRPTFPARAEMPTPEESRTQADTSGNTHVDHAVTAPMDLGNLGTRTRVEEDNTPKKPAAISKMARLWSQERADVVPAKQEPRTREKDSPAATKSRAGHTSFATSPRVKSVAGAAPDSGVSVTTATEPQATPVTSRADRVRATAHRLIRLFSINRQSQELQNSEPKLGGAFSSGIAKKPRFRAEETAHVASATTSKPFAARSVTPETPRTSPRAKTLPVSNTLPPAWPSLKSVGQETSETSQPRMRFEGARSESRVRELPLTAGSGKRKPVQTEWPDSETDDRWPELPVHQSVTTESVFLLRNVERQRALDLEQQGGR